MSIVESLHKAVDNMPEDARADLLDYIAQHYEEYLPLAISENKQESDERLKQLLFKRYEHYKAHPETALSAAESRHRTHDRYGWSE